MEIYRYHDLLRSFDKSKNITKINTYFLTKNNFSKYDLDFKTTIFTFSQLSKRTSWIFPKFASKGVKPLNAEVMKMLKASGRNARQKKEATKPRDKIIFVWLFS